MASRPPSTSLKQLFSRFRSKRTANAVLPQSARPFQAISIFRGVRACALANQMSEQRFLAKDVPSLPLPGCMMPESCECVYLKHRDRRGPQRRTMDFSASQRVYTGKERRALKGRRATD
jgi:hypothetical protein